MLLTTGFTVHRTNFLRAERELKDLQKLFTSQSTQDCIQNFTTAHSIQWKFLSSWSHFS